MTNPVQSIPLDNLVPHPDNPNQQSRVNFAKLVRNIERTGRYEPLIVRPSPERSGCFQIINGYHRCHALTKLGYKAADCIVWDIDDEQTDILLATLNRLGGSDNLSKKLKLLKRLNRRMETAELAKLLPQKQKQIERFTNLKRPSAPARVDTGRLAEPLVFFLSDEQKKVIDEALSNAEEEIMDSRFRGNDRRKRGNDRIKRGNDKMTKAARRAAGLVTIAQNFLESIK